jgi:hypothetical protein
MIFFPLNVPDDSVSGIQLSDGGERKIANECGKRSTCGDGEERTVLPQLGPLAVDPDVTKKDQN